MPTVTDQRPSAIDIWRANPELFVNDLFGFTLWSKTREILNAWTTHRKVCVVGCHGFGKSHTAACGFMHMFSLVDPVLIATTAPTHAQVNNVLWREIRKHNTAAKRRGARLFSRDPLERPYWKLDDDHLALGFASNKSGNIQGLHEAAGGLIVDEAGGVDDRLWPAIRSIMTGDRWRILLIGNPDRNDSEFAKIAGSDGWLTIWVSVFDTPNFTGEAIPEAVAQTLVSREYEREMRERYGAQSAIYRSKVLGQFPQKGTDRLIPNEWAQRVFEREADHTGPVSYGIDTARQGSDSSTLYAIRGNDLQRIWAGQIDDSMTLLDVIERSLIDNCVDKPTPGAVDIIGIGGATVVDGLRRRGWSGVQEFNASESPPKHWAASDKMECANKRTASYWEMRYAFRDWLRMAPDGDPADDGLRRPAASLVGAYDDLTEVAYLHKGSRIMLEPKEEVKKRRSGRSPDDGDGAVYALWARLTGSQTSWLENVQFGATEDLSWAN